MQANSVHARRSNGPRAARGFTLVELMVTLTVAAVLVTWSIPSLKNILIGNRLTAQTNELIASLQFARSEAIKRNLPVNVTSPGVAAPGTCAPDCSWQSGWAVWLDKNGNGVRDADEDLRVTPAVSGFSNLEFKTDRPTLTFLANGAIRQPAAATEVAFAINTTDMTSGENKRMVCIAYAGVVMSKRGRSADELACP